MQLESFPVEANLSDAYTEAASEDYIAEESGQRATAQAILAQIERHVDPGSLLDLGCWVGFLLTEARNRGWNAMGVEPSEFASAYARDVFGLHVITAGVFDAELPAGKYDAIFLGDVIEHIPRAPEALARFRQLLAPAGVLAMTLPDAGSRLARVMAARWWSVIPTHVHYFTRQSMLTLLTRQGFVPLSIRTAPKSFTVRYYLGRIGGYSPALSQAATRSAEALGLADRLWAPDFRDRMLVIASGPS